VCVCVCVCVCSCVREGDGEREIESGFKSTLHVHKNITRAQKHHTCTKNNKKLCGHV